MAARYNNASYVTIPDGDRKGGDLGLSAAMPVRTRPVTVLWTFILWAVRATRHTQTSPRTALYGSLQM